MTVKIRAVIFRNYISNQHRIEHTPKRNNALFTIIYLWPSEGGQLQLLEDSGGGERKGDSQK